MEFPKWKYAHGDAVIVQDEGEEAALVGDWFDSPAEVVAPPVSITEDEQLLIDARDEKASLRAKADALGIAIDARWGITKIKEALAGAVA